MAFMLYEACNQGGIEHLHFTGEHYSLAGNNILKQLWESKGRPLNQGWHVSADEMIAYWTRHAHSAETRRLLVDASPNTPDRIEIIEIREIWAFTLGDDLTRQAWWTPLMLNIRGVLHCDGVEDMPTEERRAMIHDIRDPEYSPECREFLYLLGDDRGWNWGMSGRTNAAYLEPQVRDYFRDYF